MLQLFLAKDRLGKTEFNSSEDWQTYPTSDFTCNSCNQVISINQRSLSKHSFSKFTNFKQPDVEAFELFESSLNIALPNSFLDFYCPKCMKPIRIYFEWGNGGKGEEYYSIRLIIEHKKDRQAAVHSWRSHPEHT